MCFLKKHKKELIFFLVTILIMLMICLLLYQPMMKLFENPQLLRHQLQRLGFLGQMCLICIMALQVIFVFLPGEIVEVMAGYLYGSIGGLIVCLIGSLIGSCIIYGFVKKLGTKCIDKLIGIDKIQNIHFLKDKHKRNILCFIIFFIPGTPKDILTYAIPLTDMKLSTFLFITTIARIPSVITSTISGHAIGIEDYLFSIIVFVMTGLISLFGIFVYKHINKKAACHL